MQKIFVAFLILLVNQCWAQRNDILLKKNWIGVIAGLNWSTKNKNNYLSKSELGFRFGMQGMHMMSDKIFLSSEISIVYNETKNSTTNGPASPVGFFEFKEFNYWIEAPIHLNFAPLRSNKNFFFAVGLAPRMLLESNANILLTFTNAIGQQTVDFNNSLLDRRNKWNLFLSSRIGYLIGNMNHKFLVSVSFERSLLKIVNATSTSISINPGIITYLPYDDPNYTLNTASLLVAYVF